MAMTQHQVRVRDEGHWPPSYPASVVVEVGPGRGALVLYGPAGLLGSELEVSPRSDPSARTHSAVRERHLPAETVYAAVFGSLPPGPYRLTGSDQTVLVIEGQVSEAVVATLG